MYVCIEADSASGESKCIAYFLIGLSWLLIIVTFPFSLFFCIKVQFVTFVNVIMCVCWSLTTIKKVKVADCRLPSIGFRS